MFTFLSRVTEKCDRNNEKMQVNNQFPGKFSNKTNTKWEKVEIKINAGKQNKCFNTKKIAKNRQRSYFTLW